MSKFASLSPPRRLSPPVEVVRREVQWDYLGSFVVLHLLALLVLVPALFSWAGVLAFFIGVTVFGQLGIPICYHRLLAHRSFRTPKWFERTLVVLALCNLQETPARWVAWHRKHHRHSDHQDDPHSPLVTFFWAHTGWLCVTNRSLVSLTLLDKYARDVLADPFYFFLERHYLAKIAIYLAHVALYFLVALLGSLLVLGDMSAALRLSASLLVWGVVLRTVYVWHITWSVNSLAHLFGYRNFDTADDSRNNWFVALITGGEGWHNNHHADQAAATVQHRWWEFDLNYYIIQLFRGLGLATHIVPAAAMRRRAARAAGG